MKRLIVFILTFLCLHSVCAADERNCVFCRIAGGSLPAEIVYRDDLVIAFMDRAPRNPGHSLVVPLQHADDIFDVPTETAKKIAAVSQSMAIAIRKSGLKAEGINIQSNSGKAAGQSVRHLHFHVVPRFVGELAPVGEKAIARDEDLRESANAIRRALAVAENRDTSAP